MSADDRNTLRLTEVCWPVFDFLINFTRQSQHGATAPPDQVRYEALSALRDAEDASLRDNTAERLWHERIKPMLVYLLDYKMLNSEWDGRDFWFDNRFETDPQVLDHIEALGGEKFFEDCDEMQREYELAERRDRRDKHELADLLSLYFICLRLGFKGMYHDRPQELEQYTRRLYSKLPASASTRGKELFPEAYKHNQEVRVDYRLGASLTIVLITLAVLIGASLVMFRVAWVRAVGEIHEVATKWEPPNPPPNAVEDEEGDDDASPQG